MKKYLTQANFHLIFGVLIFYVFAYDIENGRDFWTWGWLLIAQLHFMYFLILSIKNNKKTNKETVGNITNSTVIIK